MDLPDNLELDEENEKADEENQEENPFDIDTMKGKIIAASTSSRFVWAFQNSNILL